MQMKHMAKIIGVFYFVNTWQMYLFHSSSSDVVWLGAGWWCWMFSSRVRPSVSTIPWTAAFPLAASKDSSVLGPAKKRVLDFFTMFIYLCSCLVQSLQFLNIVCVFLNFGNSEYWIYIHIYVAKCHSPTGRGLRRRWTRRILHVNYVFPFWSLRLPNRRSGLKSKQLIRPNAINHKGFCLF